MTAISPFIAIYVHSNIEWFASFYVRVSTKAAIIDGRSQIEVHTDGHRFTALGLPRWLPIQVLTEIDVA